MNKYICDGFRSIYKDSMKDAANHFACVAANRLGKNGRVAVLQQNTWGSDSATYQAMIGKYDKTTETIIGDDLWLTIHVVR